MTLKKFNYLCTKYNHQALKISLHHFLLNPLPSFHSHCHYSKANDIYYFNFFSHYFLQHAPNRLFLQPIYLTAILFMLLVCLPQQNLITTFKAYLICELPILVFYLEGHSFRKAHILSFSNSCLVYDLGNTALHIVGTQNILLNTN